MFKLNVLNMVDSNFVKDAVVKKFDLKISKYYDSLVIKTDQGDIEVKFGDVWDGDLIKIRDDLKNICKVLDECQKEPWVHDHWKINIYVSSVLGKHYDKVQFQIWSYKNLFKAWEFFVNKDLPEEAV